jgi:hypothetical protein
MDWDPIKQLSQRFRVSAPEVTAPFALPAAVLEIQPDFVAAMRWAGGPRRGNGANCRLRSVGVAGLNPDTLAPLVNEPNIANPEELGRALQAVGGLIGNGTTRFGLLVPDGAVRVTLLSFETLPKNRREAQALMQWRIKEALPFPLEEARVSHQVVAEDAERTEVLAVAAKSSVLAGYERALEQVNGAAVVVLPATLALLPLLPETEGTGELLVHLCSGSITTAVTAGSRLRLWRTRRLGRLDEQALLHQAHAEAARVMASARDHLRVELSQVRLCARPPVDAGFGAELAQVLGQPVELLKPNLDLAATLSSEDRNLYESFGAPVAGLLKNNGFV